MGKRGKAGIKLNPAEEKHSILRMYKIMFNNHGVMPDTIKSQDLETFLLMRMADDQKELSYPESVDFT